MDYEVPFLYLKRGKVSSPHSLAKSKDLTSLERAYGFSSVAEATCGLFVSLTDPPFTFSKEKMTEGPEWGSVFSILRIL